LLLAEAIRKTKHRAYSEQFRPRKMERAKATAAHRDLHALR
jgi:hypothetical protein